MRNDCFKFGTWEALYQVTHDSLATIEFLIQADVALLLHSEWHVSSLSIAFSWSMTVDVPCQTMPWLIRECKMTLVDPELSPLVILPNQCFSVSCRMPDSSGVSPHDGRLWSTEPRTSHRSDQLQSSEIGLESRNTQIIHCTLDTIVACFSFKWCEWSGIGQRAGRSIPERSRAWVWSDSSQRRWRRCPGRCRTQGRKAWNTQERHGVSMKCF